MKRFLLIATLLLIASFAVFSQPKPYHAVFDLTTNDTATHSRVIRWINGIIEAYPDAKLELVFYGKALPMIETAIVGAGLCGLAIASGLQRRGASYAVFEARGRPGGRVQTAMNATTGMAVDRDALMSGIPNKARGSKRV